MKHASRFGCRRSRSTRDWRTRSWRRRAPARPCAPAPRAKSPATEINRFFRLEKEIVAEIDTGKLDALGKSADESATKISALYDKMRLFANSRLAPDEMTEQMSLVDDEFDHWVTVDKEVRRLAQANGDGRALVLEMTRGKQLLAAAETKARAWLAGKQSAMSEALATAREDYAESRMVLLALAGAGSLVSIVLVYLIIRVQITGPLGQLKTTMARIAAGEVVAVSCPAACFVRAVFYASIGRSWQMTPHKSVNLLFSAPRGGEVG
jgi:hypothetical protein